MVRKMEIARVRNFGRVGERHPDSFGHCTALVSLGKQRVPGRGGIPKSPSGINVVGGDRHRRTVVVRRVARSRQGQITRQKQQMRVGAKRDPKNTRPETWRQPQRPASLRPGNAAERVQRQLPGRARPGLGQVCIFPRFGRRNAVPDRVSPNRVRGVETLDIIQRDGPVFCRQVLQCPRDNPAFSAGFQDAEAQAQRLFARLDPAQRRAGGDVADEPAAFPSRRQDRGC